MEDKLVTIGSYSSISEAYIFSNILDMEGIECFVTDANASLNPPVTTPHDGGVKLTVRESDVARAISALNKQKANYR
ncbi:MAG: hypothetical protein K2X86_14600 [Cytophagaceae bacterium]|nr:hypothetical protein [Cytophagaceae bacterium]